MLLTQEVNSGDLRLSPKEFSNGLLKASQFFKGGGRASSELALLSAARDIHSNLALTRATFWAAQRGNDVQVALDACRELIEYYSQMKGPAAKKALEDVRRRPIANLTCLDNIQVPAQLSFNPIAGRLLYILNYTLPQVSNGYATRGQGLALGMQEDGVDVVCLSRPGFPLDLKTPQEFIESDTVGGVTYLHDPAPILLGTSNMSAYVPAAAEVIGKRIIELRPQAVLAASNFNNALPALIAARRLGVPFWYEVRGFWEITRLSKEPEIEGTFNYQLQRAFETYVANHADRVFTLTQPMKEELIARGVEEKRIELVPNSCDPSRFVPRPRDAELARQLGIPRDVPVIGYVGSFAPYEGLEDLADACARLRNDGYTFRLLLVGGETGEGSQRGPVTLEIERIAKEKGLGDWLIMTGRVPHEQVEGHYSLIDIAPFPRKSQPVTEMVSPLKPLEALAMEKAVAVSSLRALTEMIADDETGVVFEKDNLDSLTDVLARLLSDTELRHRLGKRGREWVAAERTWARTAEKIAGHLDVSESQIPFLTLIRQKGFAEAEQLLYADIDLNTVDGSAIWMSSMASILAASGKTIVISKNPIRRDVVINNILHREDVLLITPENVDRSFNSLTMPKCIDLIRELDDILPNLRKIVIRGLAANVEALSDRQFYNRIYSYLTDVYEHSETGISIKEEASKNVDTLARQSAAFLVQTPRLEELLRSLTHAPFKALPLPPPIPNNLIQQRHSRRGKQATIRIGYAGKIAPKWGIQQLIDWVDAARAKGVQVEVTIIGDKIAGAPTPEANKAFRNKINEGLSRIGAHRLGALDRTSVAQEMGRMDFAWCWRPGDFEEHTLELSTKLVEGIAAGIPCIAYPSATNKECLGAGYPFFAKDADDFHTILSGELGAVSPELRQRVHDRHSIEALATQFATVTAVPPGRSENVCFATHDPKFVFPYYSRLKSNGAAVRIDRWNWGQIRNESVSREHLASNDVIFCEWGLANAVWYSHNLMPGPKLIVRVHLQEINGSAQQFGYAMNHERVDTFIFVSSRVRDTAIAMFGYSAEKCVVIPNFVLENEYFLENRTFAGPIRLGMVGIAPQRKRFDRAVDLALELSKRGASVELHIKGQRPETIPFMQHKSRVDQLQYYLDQYEKVEKTRLNVIFHEWGNDVAKFYENIDYILSPSDFESFHYALADGVLSGCYPVVWPWEEAEDIYSSEWVVADVSAAAERILDFRNQSAEKRIAELQDNRSFLVQRYGSRIIFDKLDEVL